jgi:hypothetical protein
VGTSSILSIKIHIGQHFSYESQITKWLDNLHIWTMDLPDVKWHRRGARGSSFTFWGYCTTVAVETLVIPRFMAAVAICWVQLSSLGAPMAGWFMVTMWRSCRWKPDTPQLLSFPKSSSSSHLTYWFHGFRHLVWLREGTTLYGVLLIVALAYSHHSARGKLASFQHLWLRRYAASTWFTAFYLLPINTDNVVPPEWTM